MGDMIHGLTPEHLRDTDSSSGEDSDGAVLVKRPGSYVGGGAATSDLSDLGFPTLALANAQFRMIHNLDKLGFRKFPVWIHNDRHTHAAIILRLPVKRWEEGRVVVRHWVEEGFWL